MPILSPQEQSLSFIREAPLVVGEYLLGWPRWSVAMRAKSATVVAFAGADATVLELEINGALTGLTLTVPAGEANTEVMGSVDLANRVVPAGQGVRWKIISGPTDAGLAAWHATVTLQIQPS